MTRPSALQRRDLATQNGQILRHSYPGHCAVLRFDGPAGPLVIKDFEGQSRWLRWLGRFLIRREHAAYLRLGPRHGVPRLLGRVDAHALAIEWIDGRPAAELEPDSGEAARCLDRLEQLVASLCREGFFHLDLRARRNLLWRHGDVVMIDLAASLWLSPRRRWTRPLRAALAALERSALLEWKARLTPSRLDENEQRRLERSRRWSALWIFNPKRGRRADGVRRPWLPSSRPVEPLAAAARRSSE